MYSMPMNNNKSCFVAIVGRPSAGKSTLLNTICDEKVSITSPIPQTTRNKIRGIYNSERGQLVFIDTPGYHNSDKKFNNFLKDIVFSALEDAEIILYVVDSTRPPGREESEIISLLQKENKPMALALNKVDAENSIAEDLTGILKLNCGIDKLYMTSAVTKDGLPELLEALYDLAPEGENMYPEDYYTDQTPEFRIAEIIRETALQYAEKELPHALFVEISDMEWKGEEKKELWVRAFLNVERESQKGIMIGKGADKIRRIRHQSLKKLKKIFDYHIRLDLRVKVSPKWRHKDGLLKDMLK